MSRPPKTRKRVRRLRLFFSLLFSLLVFVVLLVTMCVTVGAILLLYVHGVITESTFTEDGFRFLLVLVAVSSVVLGTVISLFVGSRPLRPIRELIEAMNRLAEGDYDVRLKNTWLPATLEITDSFNALAQELSHTELLRSDFINNFSHEFKTPIVSILGFARLLKRGTVSEEQQREYLGIIEAESERLSALATNVLNLTKVESQSILTEVRPFNLSEQLRDCVLLLEKKWSAKELIPFLEFGEHTITANEELLKQVWINLLDNAVKYSPVGAFLELEIRERAGELRIGIRNFGPRIAEEDLPLIMKKFYQGDRSHTAEGNGLGLAIVARIVKLHRGTVEVVSTQECTEFWVTLPGRQEVV